MAERPIPGSHASPRRWGRGQLPEISDPYQLRGKIPEPALCPQCGAIFQAGRWKWPEARIDAEKMLCQACRRINDNYPAGIVTLSGAFLGPHKDEILNLVRHQEQTEKSYHPMNRIINVEQSANRIVINTTDIHLPRRIGEACERAFKGRLKVSYDEGAYFVRVDWHRDSAHLGAN
ncbi:MAG TPA: BCAM0308 family protein [Alphaproteobacteria bacterium]|nr:BCAM0308 family protein [Alphaproteobacteria bacterium]